MRRMKGGFRFHHVLVRDVAYAGLPLEERAELHERLADWLDGRGDADELVGYHLEQAFRQRESLGPGDGRGRRLALDAGGRLGRAGMDAWKRGDTPATVNLLTRAVGLLPESDAFRLDLLCELGPALRTGSDLTAAEETLSGAAETAAAVGDRRLELRARLELARVRLFSDPEGRAEEVLDVAAEAIPLFEAVHDDRSLSRAWLGVAVVHGPVHLPTRGSPRRRGRGFVSLPPLRLAALQCTRGSRSRTGARAGAGSGGDPPLSKAPRRRCDRRPGKRSRCPGGARGDARPIRRGSAFDGTGKRAVSRARATVDGGGELRGRRRANRAGRRRLRSGGAGPEVDLPRARARRGPRIPRDRGRGAGERPLRWRAIRRGRRMVQPRGRAGRIGRHHHSGLLAHGQGEAPGSRRQARQRRGTCTGSCPVDGRRPTHLLARPASSLDLAEILQAAGKPEKPWRPWSGRSNSSIGRGTPSAPSGLEASSPSSHSPETRRAPQGSPCLDPGG